MNPTTAIGPWLTGLVPVEMLVPEAHAAYRPMVRDAVQFVFAHLSEQRLHAKIAEQLNLPGSTPPELRLIRLISKMPGLQKLGQVLARNRHLAAPLRDALVELENGMSDMSAGEVHALIRAELGPRLERYGVMLEPAIYKEGSASAIVKFTWSKAAREPEAGAFKVLKSYVPQCFAEDMTLLQELAEYLSRQERRYGFAVRDLREMISEVRRLLEHELDFPREQAALVEAARLYRSRIGIRVPHLIAPLSTARITAMSAENGVKVTEAFPRAPGRRQRIARQIIEALIAAPLFSRHATAIFHADPHAGNLLYDEPNRELVILDWALTDRMSLAARRNVLMLAIMMLLREPEGAAAAIAGLSRGRRAPRRLIERHVHQFFATLPAERSPGVLDAMRLLDELALQGVRFPPALFLFRKVLFTLDGVLHDVAGPDFRLDSAIAQEFLTRCIGSLGLFHAPLRVKDLWPAARVLLPA